MEGVWSGVEVYVLSVAEWQDERCLFREREADESVTCLGMFVFSLHVI